MAEFDYSEQTDGVENAKPSAGATSQALPSGWYPFTVAVPVVVDAIPSTGVPVARIQLAVKEGEPYGKRRAFVDFFLGAGKTRREYKQGGKFEEFQLTPEEFGVARTEVHEKSRGLLAAMGLTLGTPVSRDINRIKEQYCTDQWEGRSFMGRITVKKDETYGDKNKLAEWAAMDDPKRGYAVWITGKWGKAKVEAALKEEKGGGGGAVPTGVTV